MNERINISQIEAWLHGALAGKASALVAVGTLPSTLPEGARDLALVEVLESRDATDCGRNMGQALANVYLYAAPRSDGRKDSAKLAAMEQLAAEALEAACCEEWTASELHAGGGYDADIRWHYAVKAYRIIIT